MDPRFGSFARLFGREAVERLAAARVAVIGVGGVGSWTAEALARSGVGHLTLIDMDDVCLTNINRQVPALTSTVGQSKVTVLASRLADINPEMKVEPVGKFFTQSTAAELLSPGFDLVIDATDRMSIKALILAECRERGCATVTVGGAGGKIDPTRIVASDLGASGSDELLRMVRRKLRRSHGWEGGVGNVYGVRAVYSAEPPRYPWADGSVRCSPEPDSSLEMDCASGFGAAVFVTATFGMIAASEGIRVILGGDTADPAGS